MTTPDPPASRGAPSGPNPRGAGPNGSPAGPTDGRDPSSERTVTTAGRTRDDALRKPAESAPASPWPAAGTVGTRHRASAASGGTAPLRMVGDIGLTPSLSSPA